MANLTAQRDTERMVTRDSDRHSATVAASATIFKGGLVGFNAAGALVRGGGAVAGFSCALVGRALDTVEDAAGTEVLDFETGVFGWEYTGLTMADIGTVVYAADDQTVNATNTNVVAGILVDIRDSKAWVKSGFYGL